MYRSQPFRLTVWVIAFVMVGAVVCQGAEPTNGDGIQMGSADELMASWVKMFGALITVLSIFFIGVLIFKKYGTLLQNKASQGHLKVLECRALNQRNAVYVLDYCGERFLVATGQQGTPGITPLTIPSEDHLGEISQVAKTHEEGFSQEIKKAMHASV